MRWVEDLQAEHRAVGRMLNVLRAMAVRLESGHALPEEDVARSLEFLKVFVDDCHHGKEERHLIPALAAAGVPTESALISKVLDEHAVGRSHVTAMREHAASMVAGDRGAAAAGFAAEIHGYSTLLEHHIAREEGELFPLGEARLDAAAQVSLAEAFDAMERDVIGPGVHEAFHQLLDRLGADYATT